MFGQHLGTGTTRDVYVLTDDPTKVIKKARTYPFSNFVEWMIWNAVKQTPLADRFGECFKISATGNYLIIERLDDMATSDHADAPAFPVWLSDPKPTNFGKANGKVQVRDYGVIRSEDLLNQETEIYGFTAEAKVKRFRKVEGY